MLNGQNWQHFFAWPFPPGETIIGWGQGDDGVPGTAENRHAAQAFDRGHLQSEGWGGPPGVFSFLAGHTRGRSHCSQVWLAISRICHEFDVMNLMFKRERISELGLRSLTATPSKEKLGRSSGRFALWFSR